MYRRRDAAVFFRENKCRNFFTAFVANEHKTGYTIHIKLSMSDHDERMVDYMLKKFEVENYKNFKDRISIDF